MCFPQPARPANNLTIDHLTENLLQIYIYYDINQKLYQFLSKFISFVSKISGMRSQKHKIKLYDNNKLYQR